MIWDGIWDTFLQGDFITAFIQLLLAIIITIVNIILIPIGYLIQTLVPDIDTGLQAIATYFDNATTYLSWAISLVGLPTSVIIVVISYYIAVLSSTIFIWIFKLAVIWWRAIR